MPKKLDMMWLAIKILFYFHELLPPEYRSQTLTAVKSHPTFFFIICYSMEERSAAASDSLWFQFLVFCF